MTDIFRYILTVGAALFTLVSDTQSSWAQAQDDKSEEPARVLVPDVKNKVSVSTQTFRPYGLFQKIAVSAAFFVNPDRADRATVAYFVSYRVAMEPPRVESALEVLQNPGCNDALQIGDRYFSVSSERCDKIGVDEILRTESMQRELVMENVIGQTCNDVLRVRGGYYVLREDDCGETETPVVQGFLTTNSAAGISLTGSAVISWGDTEEIKLIPLVHRK